MSLTARFLAAEVLIDVVVGDKYSNLILPKTLAKSGLSDRDRSLATELVYGTIRLKKRHDARIAHVSERSLSDIDSKLLVILEMGVHQLYEMRIPDHAAVTETVDIAKKICGQGSGAFTNAILRQLVRNTDIQLTNDEHSSHPEWIVSSYRDALRDEKQTQALLEANNAPVSPTLVAWPGKSSLKELVDAGAQRIVGTRFAAQYAGNPATLPAIKERRAGVQDYGSQLVTELFAATQNSHLRWLDMCAGPGGKSALLSALLPKNANDFVANEISLPRAELVRHVIHHGIVNTADARSMSGETYDRILLDAPCSGIGALRRRPELRWRRSLQDVKNLVILQRELFDSAVRNIAPGGLIGYVTCSPHIHETRQQVRHFLKTYPDISLMSLEPYMAAIEAPERYRDALLEDGTLQLWTHRHETDSMFMALFQRRS